MNKFSLWFLTTVSFLFFLMFFYGLSSYLFLSLPPFNSTVLPDTGTLIVVVISAIGSIFLSVYFSMKVYIRFRL